MQNRWTVLALLFTVRLAMAFQFQAAGAVSPAFMNTYGVALADIGLLISIYLAPGILFAVPGGEIGRRFGDKSVVLFGLALMIAGGLVMAMATSWHGQLAGRLLAGIGGVLINVLMSKMVTDWFAGKEIATAMAIFVNSWPAGIAIALMVLPVVAAAGGVVAVAATTAVLALIGLILLAALYQAPTDQRMAAGAASTWPEGNALRAVLAAPVTVGAPTCPVAACPVRLFVSLTLAVGVPTLPVADWPVSAVDAVPVAAGVPTAPVPETPVGFAVASPLVAGATAMVAPTHWLLDESTLVNVAVPEPPAEARLERAAPALHRPSPEAAEGRTNRPVVDAGYPVSFVTSPSSAPYMRSSKQSASVVVTAAQTGDVVFPTPAAEALIGVVGSWPEMR
ncbi:MAG: MFS transporter [Hyphomicrobium sp.]|nr:MFS transporter [Hyphomicrobium sp.]